MAAHIYLHVYNVVDTHVCLDTYFHKAYIKAISQGC